MYTIDDIVFHTGIPANKAAEICNLLVMEGHLIFNKETRKYRLTKDRDLLESVKKLWDQCRDDHSFEQMSGKIEDIMEFGKPLALSEKEPGSIVKDIGVPGLNFIFGHLQEKKLSDASDGGVKRVPGIPRGHCLLIKGAPGTGKTTLGMQIALYLKRNQYRTRFLTFEEDVNQLIKDFDGYLRKDDEQSANGWDKSVIKEVTRSLIKIRTPQAWENPDMVMEELISFLDKDLPHLIVIDSISRFRDLGGDNKARQILRRLIRHLKCRRITAIFTGEDQGGDHPFEEYEVDGIIHLQWAGDLLTLTVKKLRGLKAYKGPHSAALMSNHDLGQPQNKLIAENEILKNTEKGDGIPLYLTVGFNVFPDISVYKDTQREDSNIDKKGELQFISTGTEGLDNLLSLPDEEKEKRGFKRKETILLVGSAGSGKTLMALNFMQDGFTQKNIKKENAEKMLWINLEGDMGTLKFASSGFKDDLGKSFRDMLTLEPNKETGAKFDFIDFPPINLDLNKIVYTLEAINKKHGIDRLVIDSITELERAKGAGQPAVKVFLAGLIQFLRDRDITTIFVCRSDAFFRSIDKIEEQVSSLVDLIICIRNFDIHNQIEKGIYIQKARGRYHNSKIMRLHIDSRQGLNIEDSGWDLENLLAGDTSFIQSPNIFFKLFYENPAEEQVNKKIIADFNEHRYPGDNPKFTLVKKPSIYTEFWSFRGQFSAGHANTRILSIPDYVITAFRDNTRLASLDKYVKTELLRNIESEKHLIRRYQKKEEEKEKRSQYLTHNIIAQDKKDIDAVPCYRDYGVMVFRKRKSKKGEKTPDNEIKEFEDFIINKLGLIKTDNDIAWKNNNYKWEEILKLIDEINKEEKTNEVIPFAFPPLDKKSEFVAFFMELLWSHGGDIFKADVKANENEEKTFSEKILNSVFLEFIKFCYKEYTTEEILEALKEAEKPPKYPQLKILEDFEKKFIYYGLESKKIEIEDFKEWLVKNLEDTEKLEDINQKSPEKPLKEKSMLVLYDDPFKEAIKLMLRLVYRAGVNNPVEGEFRHRAILSRYWYSRIFLLKEEKCRFCDLFDNNECLLLKKNKENVGTKIKEKKCIKPSPLEEDEYKLLPLPLGKIKLKGENKKNKPVQFEYYRSVTCLTYWSLVMLSNALSPEIGGNFIESMNAPDYQEERLKSKAGMPVTNIDLKKDRFKEFDQDSYSIFGRILDNSFKKLETTTNIKKKFSVEEDYTALHYEFIGHIQDRNQQVQFFNNHKNDFHQRIFFAQVRQSRTAFYQLEEALHYQLSQLFIKDPESRDENLYDRAGNKGQPDIVENIKALCEQEKENAPTNKEKEIEIEKNWGKYLDKISDEFRMHVIFELLTYFFHEYSRGAMEESK